MMSVTVSGLSIIVLRTATSMLASAPACPLRCATTSWLGSCHAQPETSPARRAEGRGGRRADPLTLVGLLVRARLPAERVTQLVRIGRHHRMRPGAGQEPARDEALAVPVALLPDPEAR